MCSEYKVPDKNRQSDIPLYAVPADLLADADAANVDQYASSVLFFTPKPTLSPGVISAGLSAA